MSAGTFCVVRLVVTEVVLERFACDVSATAPFVVGALFAFDAGCLPFAVLDCGD